MEVDWAGSTGKGIGKVPTKIEEGLDEGVPEFKGVFAATELGLEESSKTGLQEAGKGIDNGGDLDNKDL